MNLKQTVDAILKSKSRSLRWLATEMDKTPDGLKLSLVRHSIKYIDIISMSAILDVPISKFFEPEPASEQDQEKALLAAEQKTEDIDLKNSLKAYRELISTLKDQIKDKDRIIKLLDKDI
ncbi:hypothetical protein [Pedobacter sp. MC2016-24]|uniref:hypothetical protein n=1 Tax=Pedobacter sp. MC2016-24 TaxID=2780090 RepID=UPI0018814304|nr:hypothetical protein [Pedobacter sp. MC2016-24]MBE9600866.1 hypothetical protein [Pedobacter sp. MC2016-24]